MAVSTRAPKKKLETIELHFAAGNQQIRVVPEDNDLMMLTTKHAIDACRAYNDQLTFKSQFDNLLNKLGAWLSVRLDKIAEAHVTARDAGLLFLVVLKGDAYDHDFEADLTKLDIEIANDCDFEMISLSVLALPKCDPEAVRSFLSTKMMMRYAIDGNRS